MKPHGQDVHEISGSQCDGDEDSELMVYDAILTGKFGDVLVKLLPPSSEQSNPRCW